MRNLQQFIRTLRQNNEIVDILEPVDPNLEIAEIHRRVIAANGPALLFHNVKGSPFPVATNLFGSMKRIELAFGKAPEQVVKDLVSFITGPFPPKLSHLWDKRSTLSRMLKLGMKGKRNPPVLGNRGNDLEKLPLLTSWPEDGGPFITLPLVYTEPVGKGPHNLGMYRIQRYDSNTCGLHFQIGKGAGFHLHQAEQENKRLPVSIFVGGPPALILSAIAPLPENVPELLFCSLVMGEKLPIHRSKEMDHPVIGECDFVLQGYAEPNVRRDEGPFGDHYGYYSLKHPFPVFNCTSWHHRKDAIYPATIVGKPRQEDYYIGEYLQKLLSPLFPIVMPAVKQIWSYGETGFHSLGAAVVKERYAREGMAQAFRILGEGQLALTKFLLLTDQPVDASKIKEVLPTILERFEPEKDLYVFSNLSLDTLDYTGPTLNKGSRGVLMGMGEKKRDLPHEFKGELPRAFKKARAFCPGCLVVEGEFEGSFDAFEGWPLVIVVDSLEETLKSEMAFLWTVFTRFEPGADIYTQPPEVFRHHLMYKIPIIIDARMKPSYPGVVECDEETEKLVSKRWNRYFPTGQEMGHDHV